MRLWNLCLGLSLILSLLAGCRQSSEAPLDPEVGVAGNDPGAPAGGTPSANIARAPQIDGAGGSDIAAISDDEAVLLCCSQPGIYRITGNDLLQMGVDITLLDPAKFTLEFMNQAVPIQLMQSDPRRFQPYDAIYFYSKGGYELGFPYVNDIRDFFPMTQRFLLKFNGKPGQAHRLEQVTVDAPGKPDAKFPVIEAECVQRLELNINNSFTYREDSVARGERTDYLYWHRLTVPETDKTFSSCDIELQFARDQIEHPLELEFQLAAAASMAVGGNWRKNNNGHRVRVDLNKTTLTVVNWANTLLNRSRELAPREMLREGTNTLTFTLLEPTQPLGGTPAFMIDQVFLDWVKIKTREATIVKQGQGEYMIAAEPDAEAGKPRRFRVGGLETANATLIDRRENKFYIPKTFPDPDHPGKWAANLKTDSSTITLLASVVEKCLKPDYTTLTQVTHYFDKPEPDVEFLILTNRKFTGAMKRFVDWKQKRGLNTKMVEIEHLIMERTGGNMLSSALRDYVHHVATSTTPTRLRYVLLVGDAAAISHYRTETPAYSYTETGHPANENYFGTLADPMDNPDFGVGRFSVLTPEQVDHIVDKVIDYESGDYDGIWRSRFLLIAASEEWASNDALRLINDYIKPDYVTQFLKSDPHNANPAYHMQLNRQLVDYFNAGSAITVFFGHGGGTIWEIGPTLFQGAMTKHLFDQSNVANLTNTTAPPLVFALTCYTNDFDNPDVATTLGETFLNSPGGAIGVIGSAVRSSTYLNYQFVDKFMKALGRGKKQRLGDILKETKRTLNTKAVNNTYVLLGDPSLEFALPAPSIGLNQPRRDADRITVDYVLPTSTSLPAKLTCALLDDKDRELDTWDLSASALKGELVRPLDKLTTGSQGQIRMVVYVPQHDLDMIGSTPLLPFKSGNNADENAKQSAAKQTSATLPITQDAVVKSDLQAAADNPGR